MKRLILSSMIMFLIGLTVFTGGCSDDSDEQVLTGQSGRTGWAAGSSMDGYGTIIHTKDGGVTWIRLGGPKDIPDVGINCISVLDENNAWVVGGDNTMKKCV